MRKYGLSLFMIRGWHQIEVAKPDSCASRALLLLKDLGL